MPTHRLCLPPRLDDGSPPAVLIHGLDVVAEAQGQTAQRQQPEDDAERLRHAQLDGGGLGLEVEGDDDGDGNDGHVEAEAQVGEEGSLVGAVVARVGVGVVEEERLASDGS